MFRSASRASKISRNLMLSGAVMPMFLASAAMAQTATDQASQQTLLASKRDPSETVIVTGSRGKERTVTSSATPIDVLKGSAIEQAGQGSVLAALDTLIPSFIEPAIPGGSTATVIHTGGLRGLNPDQTLILVNGKRRHRTALINAASSLYNGSVPIDLDLISPSAIDHIEVLRDGAAAQYGSDAIAGVVNIILKKDTSGALLSASAGQNMDRNDGQIFTQGGHVGLNLFDNGFLDLSANATETLVSNRALPVASNIVLYNLINGQPDPREATINRLITHNNGMDPQRTINTAYNAEYSVGDGMTVYSFGTMSHRVSDLLWTYRQPNNIASLPQIYPNGFAATENIDEWDYEGALGVRGSLEGWDWDASTSFGTDQAKEDTYNNINASLGPTSPTRFHVGKLESVEWVNSLDVTRGFPVGGGSLQVSFGFQHRQERFDILAGDPAASAIGNYVIPAGQPFAGQHPPPSAQSTGGISAADAGHLSRNNMAAYIDVAWDPSEDLTIGAAGRFEHYDDASGDSVIGKINARYALTPWLALRGDINTGFRAPALAQELWASTTSQFQLIGATTTLLQIKSLPVASAAAVALGATPLQPEKSLNYSGGVVLTPMPDLDVTVDAYSIDVYDHIEPTGTLTGAAVSNILVGLGLPNNISATYFTNAINTRTQGYDVVGSYDLDVGDFGQMLLSASMNYNVTTITHTVPNPPQLAALGSGFVIFDARSKGNLTLGLPKTKVVLSDTWNWNDFTLVPKLIRFGGFTTVQNLASQTRSFNAKWITDLELSWRFSPQWSVAVGANNLLNVYPSPAGIFNPATGTGQYPGSSPFGFTGGFYYTRLSVSF